MIWRNAGVKAKSVQSLEKTEKFPLSTQWGDLVLIYSMQYKDHAVPQG